MSRTTWALVALALMSAATTVSAQPAPAGDVVILGETLSAKSANVVSADPRYSDLVVCRGAGGFEQWTAAVEKAGPYFIHFRYSAGQRRPCRLLLNGRRCKASVLGEVTGGFSAEHLVWKTYGPLDLKQGDNTVRLESDGHMPHLMGLVVSVDKAAPKDEDNVFQEQRLRHALEEQKKRAVQTAATRAELQTLLPDTERILFIRRNTCTANHYYTDHINDLSKPGGNLCVLNLRDGTVTELVKELDGGWFGRFDLSFDARKIVFDWKASRKQGYRIYEIDIDPATGLRTPSGRVRQLTFPAQNEAEEVAKYGKSRGGEPWYHHGTDDMHPCYLPEGDIVFTSTRCRYGVLCDSQDVYTVMTLYRMRPDGRGMRKLSNSALSESSPCIMPDGRILYTRWEYVDKGHIGAKCLWAMKPDGTGSVEIYGNDISNPSVFIYGRPIPGKANQYVFLGTPHCPNSIGTVIRVDTNKNTRTREPMTYMTPQVDIRSGVGFWYRKSSGQWQHDNKGTGPLFKDPYPLSAERFLVAHKAAGPPWDDATAYNLALLNDAGETRTLYTDPSFSCWQPYPLRARPKPPILASSVDARLAKENQAVCVVADIYHGMEDVSRGTIKYIRILEQVPRPWSARRADVLDAYHKAHVVLARSTVIGLKVLWGIVPVENDGSAHFIVPANRNIYLQALDKNFLAVQSERSYVNYRPGETRACIGCHETSGTAPPRLSKTAMALKRPPSVAEAQPDTRSARRTLHYPTDVQPVLDKHCVKCHKPGKKSGGVDLTGTPTQLFSISYESLMAGFGKRLALVLEAGGNDVGYLPARSCFSYNTTLVAMLSRGKVQLTDKGLAKRAAELAEKHKEVDLTTAELLKISTWLDSNCQYYGSYWGRRHVKYRNDPGYRPNVTFEQAISTTPPE